MSEHSSKPKFSDQFAPRHPGIARLSALLKNEADPAPAKRMRKSRAQDLLTAYLGTRLAALFEDAEARPSHYGEEHHALIAALRTDASAGTTTARSDLMLQYMRRSEASQAAKEIRRNKTATQDDDDEPAFEQQDLFKGAIVII